MRRLTVSVVLLSLVAIATGQWVDRTLWIPDSLHGIYGSDNILVEPGNGRVWLAGYDAERIQVFDPATGAKVAYIDEMYNVTAMAHSAPSHRVYAIMPDEEFIAAIDDRDFSVTALIDSLPEPFALAYDSRDDKMYVGSRDDAVIWVFDPGPDTLLRVLYADDWVQSLVYDSAANRLYALSGEGGAQAIYVYACANDSLVGTMPASIYGANFDLSLYQPSRRLYATVEGLYAPEILIYDLDSLVQVDSVTLPREWELFPVKATLNPQTGRLYVWYWDLFRRDYREDSIAVLDCATGTFCFVALPDDHYPRTVTAAGNKVYVTPWDAESLAVLGVPDSVTGWIRLPDGDLTAAGWNPGRNEVYVADGDDQLHVIDVAGDTVTRAVDYGRFWPSWMLWNPTGKMYAGSWRELLALTPQDSVLFRRPVAYSYSSGYPPAWSPELNRLYFAYYDSLAVWDCNGDTEVRRLWLPTYTVGAWAVPGRNRVYIWGAADTMLVYDTYRDTLLGLIPAGAGNLAFNRRTGLVYAYKMGYAAPVSVIDPRRDTVVALINAGGQYIFDIAVNPQDNEVYLLQLAVNGDSLLVLDGSTHQRLRTLWLPDYPQYLCYVEEWNQLLALRDSCAWVMDCPARQVDRRVSLPYGSWNRHLWNPRNDKLYLYPGSYLEGLAVIKLPQDTLVATLPLHWVVTMGWNPVANEMYAAEFGRLSIIRDDMTGIAASAPAASVSALRVGQNPSAGPVRFSVNAAGPARLTVFDMTGRLTWACDVGKGRGSIGWNRVDLQGRPAPAGVYVARLEAGPGRESVKVVLR